MPLAVNKRTLSSSDPSQTHTLDGAAAGIGKRKFLQANKFHMFWVEEDRGLILYNFRNLSSLGQLVGEDQHVVIATIMWL
jgi:hypothetical protein